MSVSAGHAQYPGKVTKSDNDKPVLRSVAVLEWTGEPGKPSASRLVPVAVFDGEHLNDGTIYLNRPEPLALESGVEYELQMAGKPQGIFDVFGSGESQGSWAGFGVWRPLTAASQKAASEAINTSSLFAGSSDADDDHPVLKRKHPKGTDGDADSTGKSSSDSSGSSSKSGAGIGSDAGKSSDSDKSSNIDPDRPQLKRKTDDSSATSSTSAADPDRPQLKRKTDSSDNSAGSDSSSTQASAGTGSVDPDRPTLRRSHHAEESDMSQVSKVPPDPNRPHLGRGKPADTGPSEASHLVGLPPTMQQAVAVSDALNHSEHPWKYSWANPDDELKMKESLEAMARHELGLDAPAAPAHPARKTTTTAAKATAVKKAASATSSTEPVPLSDEVFRVFELTYGGSATMVLTASTAPPAPPEGATPATAAAPDAQEPPSIRRGKPTTAVPTPKPSAPAKSSTAPAPKAAPQKFVTLIAQPDLYGGVLVIYKSVTDSAHLDETPRLRLVDAVDAMGDNRGELLFEMRGDQQRQFALFRVLRGSAEQLFATVAIPDGYAAAPHTE